MYNETVKNEAIRLRTEERLSLKDIATQVGIAKSTASYWLRDYPLDDEEKLERYRRAGRESPGQSPRTAPCEESSLYQLKGERKFTNLQKAKISEAAVLLRLFVRGYSVYGSSFDGDKFDWIVETKDGIFVTVQVKSTYQAKHGSPRIRLRCSNGRKKSRRYLKGEFDIVVGYDLFSDIAFVWTFEEVKHLRNGVSCCEDAKERWDKLNSLER